MPLVASAGPGAYSAPVRRIVELLALVAILIMPFGMTPAAARTAHHDTMASMPTDHCSDQHSPKTAHGGFAECTMACSAALPAGDAKPGVPAMIICEPVQPSAAQRLDGVHPDIATPPPKRS